MMDKDLIDFNKARPAGLISLKLPAFWIDKPVSWSVLAESQFRLHGIHREQTRYGYLLSALTKEAVSLIPHVVKHPPEHHPYSALKQSLLDSHELTDYQKIAALHKMEPLGGSKSCWPPCWSSVLEATKLPSSSRIFSWRDFPLSCG
jgi:hypothetical protein